MRAAMNRPARQRTNLVAKLESKTSRTHKDKLGKKAKRWKAATEKYAAAAEGAAPPAAEQS